MTTLMSPGLRRRAPRRSHSLCCAARRNTRAKKGGGETGRKRKCEFWPEFPFFFSSARSLAIGTNGPHQNPLEENAMRSLFLQASREARRHAAGKFSKSSVPGAVGVQSRSFAAAPVKANAATPKQREVSKRRKSQGGGRRRRRRDRLAIPMPSSPCASDFDAPVPVPRER